MEAPVQIPGSFRDPAGRVFQVGDRIFRAIAECAARDYEQVRDAGLLERLADDGLLTAVAEVDPAILGEAGQDASYVIEHPRIPFITFPYEWSFSALKAAARLHLELHLRLIEHDMTLSDASAYNIQFIGPKPTFIDTLSLRPYRDGEYWLGHRQFCDQFLNPLLLRACIGMPHNAWYRGSLEGISSTELSRILPFRSKLSWRIASQVVLPAKLQRRAVEKADGGLAKMPERGLSKPAFKAMLSQLLRWIETMIPADVGKTVWQDYAQTHSYNDPEEQAKRDMVEAFVKETKPALLFDFGCNSGAYSALALSSGAGSVIGFDMDQGALERAFARALADDLTFLPLYLDAANPSPAQGWRQAERPGLADRGPANALLALAFVHHLAIARNIPLDQLLAWLTSLAPTGVIEFVPKNDPTVQCMLALRQDIFSGYNVSNFAASLSRHARIVQRTVVSATGRELFWYSS